MGQFVDLYPPPPVLCRSRITTSSIARILSSVSAVGGRPRRGTSSKARVGSLDSATYFATVRYNRAVTVNISQLFSYFCCALPVPERSGAVVRALSSYANGSSSILGKGKNQNIGRSPISPTVNGYLVLLGPGKVKAVGRDAGHITLLCAEAAES